MMQTAEHKRLAAHRQREENWRNWGPYLSERAWGTVREDYSPNGTAWDYFPHEQARSRAYRWNEDGLCGISDRNQHLCFALALWNGRDPILKERLFGLTGPQGNHGEDVKEAYFYLDSTPTHSYMQMLYKYPHAAYPYELLVRENAHNGIMEPEYELHHTGVFDDDHYFDIFTTYGKAGEDDILIEITVHNRSANGAPLHLLPTLWFRNTWSWGYDFGPLMQAPGKPRLYALNDSIVRTEHKTFGDYTLYFDGDQSLLFTENETNNHLLFDSPNASRYVKDAFHRYIVDRESTAVNPSRSGTKVAAHIALSIPARSSQTIRIRLSKREHTFPFEGFDDILLQRKVEADDFYKVVQPKHLTEDERRVQRQAFAGMLWGKQLYYYDIAQWLDGDPGTPTPPAERKNGRNSGWRHLNNFDVISMPDKWEYPWYATWDSAFHCLPLVLIDPDYAKRQLELFTREWYMHPNGQLPAYEWALGDVNPPVHAWAAWRVYKIDAKSRAAEGLPPDRDFLEGIFHKMMLNFTWWVNRKDADGNNIFQGGFLGLDNISVIDRSQMLATGAHLDQSDGTAWMAFFAVTMVKIALELAKENRVYEDSATKFFEHFLAIAHAMSFRSQEGYSLYDQDDGFFYDAIHYAGGGTELIKVRSLVGLMPLIAVETLEPDHLEDMPDFERRMEWFLQHRPAIAGKMADPHALGKNNRHLLSIVTEEQLRSLLHYMLDEAEFLSPYGIRSLSKFHEEHPYSLQLNGQTHTVEYWPAESRSGLFGGNSNWRGPVWFPINYLLIESLQKYHHYYGDDFTVEYPRGSGKHLTLKQVATNLSQRLMTIFLQTSKGERPFYGQEEMFQHDEHWRDHILFYEYFHGDNGTGVGASHQTGWTGLVAKLIQQSGGDSL